MTISPITCLQTIDAMLKFDKICHIFNFQKQLSFSVKCYCESVRFNVLTT